MSRDRFEAMVEKYTGGCNVTIRPEDLLQLLRREHAALTRAVKRLQVDKYASPNVRLGYAIAISDILALLAARKGRTG